MRFARTLSEAFPDGYCIEGPRGQKSGYYTQRRSLWQRFLILLGVR